MISRAKKMAPGDPLQIFRTQRRPIMLTFSCIMLVAVAVTFLGPKWFRSEAKLFVLVGHDSVSIDPTATTGQTVSVQEPRDNEINSIIELLKSRVILQSVVTSLGPEAVLGRGTSSESGQLAGLAKPLNIFAPYSVEDEAIKKLFSNLSVVAAKKSNIIGVSYDANSPELARDVVTKLIEEVRQAHMRVHRTTGSQEFFAAQVGHLQTKLVQLERELRDVKNTSGVASLTIQRDLKLEQVHDLERSLLKAESTLSATTAEMKAHQTSLQKLPENITTDETTGMPHSKIAAMREKLFELQIQEKEILSKYTPLHPHAVAMRDEVAAIEHLLKEEPPESQVTKGRNTAHVEIQLASLKTESSAASLQAEAATLRKQLEPARQDIQHFNNKEVEIARLEREIALDSANYKKYSEALEQARIDNELELRNISNLNVLQPASYSITPSRPRPIFNLGIGLLAAMASSVVVGLLLEQRRSRWTWASQSTLTTESPVAPLNPRFETNPLDEPWETTVSGGNGNGWRHDTTS